MLNRKRLFTLLSAACAWWSTACDEPPEQPAQPRFGDFLDASVPAPDAASELNADGAVSTTDAVKTPRVGPVFGVVSGDYTASSISLLDGQGNLVADDYINSGAARAGLVTALSGDVDLPTRSGEHGVLVLLDRFKTDVLTRIRLSDATILGQLKTHTPPTQATENAYSSNPQDYLFIDATTAWITRQEPNLDPSVPELDRGTDLLRIDPSTMQRTSERIDLSGLNTKATRLDPGTQQMQEVEIYARPVRMVRSGDTLVVGLYRMSFDYSVAGPGMVALVDLKTRAVQGFELPGLSVCSRVSYVPDQADVVLVGCSGSGGDDPRRGAGIALLRVGQSTAELSHVWRASEHPSDPAASNDTVSLGGTLVAAVAFGTRAQPAAGARPAVAAAPDQLVVLDLASGAVVKELLRSATPYSIGPGLFDAESRLLLIPDASVDADQRPTAGLRRFRFSAPSSFEELPVLKVAAHLDMPVRSVQPL